MNVGDKIFPACSFIFPLKHCKVLTGMIILYIINSFLVIRKMVNLIGCPRNGVLVLNWI